MFNYMNVQGDSYFTTSKVKFLAIGTFKNETVEKVFEFAYEMSFGKSGEHRDHRSGGTYKRKPGEIFANAFQGKLAECAVYNQLYDKRFDISPPDFETYELGKWDAEDFVINGEKVSIKSTKSFGNLLLLEKKDWSISGKYLPNDETYEYTFLVRLNPYCEDIMKKLKLLYATTADMNDLKRIIMSEKWQYDIPGYITNDDLIYIINNNFVINRGNLLNGKIPMDATNYYVQAGDMRPLSEFIGG